MSVAGIWKLTVATPIGNQTIVVDLVEDGDTFKGTAKTDSEEITLVDPTLAGNRLTWSQSITKPMSLTLKFDLTVDGDTLSGTTKSSILPSSKVTGVRA